ncbi:MAG TPA: DUF2007 domain-containing protein [Candidatus Deferrimicrobiaceae bacterium]|jgi:hypothetical protein
MKDKSIVLSVAIVVASFYLTIRLYFEAKYHSSVGWAIITSCLIFFLLWEILSKGNHKKELVYKYTDAVIFHERIKHGANKNEYVTVLSLKDSIKVKAIVDALKQNNVDSVVLDRNSAQMLQFLPGVEMRIMTPAKDYDESVRIIKGLLGQ